jgi:hypothetical protein
MNDPYKYLWREEITEWCEPRQTVFGLEGDIPNHTYISKGTELYGYIKKGSSEIHWFKLPFKAWSVTRRKFRKLNKREIDFYVQNSNSTNVPFAMDT